MSKKYIDATELMRDGWYLQKQQHEGSGVYILTWQLQDVPAADVRPNVRGEWLHDKDDSMINGYCSCCGWEAIILETDVSDERFCPHCGADMRGEE